MKYVTQYALPDGGAQIYFRYKTTETIAFTLWRPIDFLQLRHGSVTMPAIEPLSSKYKSISFVNDPMSHTSYHVQITHSSMTGGYAEIMPAVINKTLNGFEIGCFNNNPSVTSSECTFDWIAIQDNW